MYIKCADTEGPKNTEKERAKGATATGLCKWSGFVALSTIGVARDILGELATPIIIYTAKYRYACLACSVRQGARTLDKQGGTAFEVFKPRLVPIDVSPSEPTIEVDRLHCHLHFENCCLATGDYSEPCHMGTQWKLWYISNK